VQIARRARIAKFASLGKRVGYLALLVAIVAFFVGGIMMVGIRRIEAAAQKRSAGELVVGGVGLLLGLGVGALATLAIGALPYVGDYLLLPLFLVLGYLFARVAARQHRQILRLVGLEDSGNQFPDQLSGGMQQRVGLARAFAVDPKVMLYDEPFSALDPLIRRDMQDEIVRLHREVGKTMVFVTHDLSEALKLGDRILIMRDGEIVQVGTPDEIIGAPADDYVRDFTSEVPKSHVLTLKWVMRPPAPDDSHEGVQLPSSTVIRDAARSALGQGRHPIQVVDDGELVGMVDEDAIFRAVVAEDTGTPQTEGVPA